MTRRRWAGVGIALAFWIVAPVAVRGQGWTAHGGGGAVVPVGRLASIARLGYGAFGGATVRLGDAGWIAGGDVLFGRLSHDQAGGRSTLFGAFGAVGFEVHPSPQASLAVLTGLGPLLHARASSGQPGLNATRGGLALKASSRLAVDLGPARIVGEVSYTLGAGGLNRAAYPTEVLVIGVGAELPLGGR